MKNLPFQADNNILLDGETNVNSVILLVGHKGSPSTSFIFFHPSFLVKGAGFGLVRRKRAVFFGVSRAVAAHFSLPISLFRENKPRLDFPRLFGYNADSQYTSLYFGKVSWQKFPTNPIFLKKATAKPLPLSVNQLCGR